MKPQSIITIDREMLRTLLLDRDADSHKGDYGHALLVCGCERMPGAAVLATGAALKSGCGLVTLRSTRTACGAAMSSCPSAMLLPEAADVITSIPCDYSRYDSVGIGPGLGKDERTVCALRALLQSAREGSLVLDADALNIISEHREMLDLIPCHSILTPHFGELKRLLNSDSPTEDMIIDFAKCRDVAIVAKGPGTHVYADGCIYINTTGNAGMAKGGSGDVLTGLIAGLIARGYQWDKAAILAVWLHGYAGDRLSAERTAECYCSRDIIDFLHLGFIELYK